MTERFAGNDLDAWCEHFSVTKLKDKILELGAETVQDLQFIYEDAEMLAQIKEASPTPIPPGTGLRLRSPSTPNW
jgi:hypothetical protein